MRAKKEVQHTVLQEITSRNSDFQGQILYSSELKTSNLSGKTIAILGTDQFTVSQLKNLSEIATQVFIFQDKPKLILPQSSKLISLLIPHPLFARNRRLFSNCVKRVLALRFLEKEVSNLWLRRLLTANAVQDEKVFLKSDSYFQTLQQPNCELITWPVAKIAADHIETINALHYKVDVLVYTN